MIVRWRGDRALADREGVAALYEVSRRTVRRYCEPIDYDPETGRALYDVLACEELLAGVLPRPDRRADMRAVLARRRAVQARERR